MSLFPCLCVHSPIYGFLFLVFFLICSTSLSLFSFFFLQFSGFPASIIKSFFLFGSYLTVSCIWVPFCAL